jgi:hypothetical protein
MSAVQNQKEAVFSAVTSVLNEAGISLDGQDASSLLSRELRSQVTSILVEGFKSNSVSLSKTFDNDNQLRTYCSGLLSNWLKKDKRLNGNTKYAAKNPGSRRGSADPQVQALRKLQGMQTDPDKIAEIQSFIEKRLNEISPHKSVSINSGDIPSELHHML